MRRVILSSATAVLVACGGGGDSDFEAALAAAQGKEREARTLGVAAPCGAVEQCGALQLANPTKGCGVYTYQPYSLVSTSATAASDAAAEQRRLAAVARDLDKPSPVFCPAVVEMPPPLACVAGRCQAAP